MLSPFHTIPHFLPKIPFRPEKQQDENQSIRHTPEGNMPFFHDSSSDSFGVGLDLS